MEIGTKKAVRFGVVFFLSIVILALLAPSLAAKAQQVTYGVYADSSLVYGTPDGSPWVQTSPSGSPAPTRWNEFVNCSKLSFRIINQSNPNSLYPGYTFNETLTFRNGTAPVNLIGSVDLYYGAGLGENFFISPGLHNDSYIYPGAAASGNFTWQINYTRNDMSYWPGVTVCVLNYTRYTPNENKSSPLIATQTTFIWDQRTGVLLGTYVGAYGVDQMSGTYVSGVLLYELIANNVQIPMNYPSSLDLTPIYVLVAIFGVVALAFVIVRATGGKPKGKYKRLKDQGKTV